MSAGVFDKIKKFFAMESEEMVFDSSAESVEYRSAATDLRNYEEKTLPKPNVVGASKSSATRKQEIVVFQPGTFSEAQQVAEHIKARKSVIINVKRTDKDLAKRIIDFLSGISYAVDGHVQKIADNIFLFAPAHIDVTMVDQSNDSMVSEDPLFTHR